MSIRMCVPKCVWQQVVWFLALITLVIGPVAGQRGMGDLKLRPSVFETAKIDKGGAVFSKPLARENRRDPYSSLAGPGFVYLGDMAKNYEFINGQWFDGRRFISKGLYSVNGVLSSRKPVRVDSVIDLRGSYVIPPFGEAHNHNLDWSSDEQFARIRGMYLKDGIFYVKNPNSLPRATAPLNGKINIPTSVDAVFANGGLTASGGHPIETVRRNIQRGGMTEADGEGGFYFTIDNLADLDRKWETIKIGKPDFIKTYLIHSEEYEERKNDEKVTLKGLNPALLPEIVRRAHASGLRVSTHVETAIDFHNALVAGVDEINHTPGFHTNDKLALTPYKISEMDARLAARKHVFVVTTLGEAIDKIYGKGETMLESRSALYDLLVYNLQILKKHGVPIAIGSDEFRETSLPEAMKLHKLKVFDNVTLLKMWCETTAATIFPKRKIGFLKDGFEASFLVLNANPLEDFANVQKIEMRVKQGEILTLNEGNIGAKVDAYIKPYLEMGSFSGAVLIAKGGEVLAWRTMSWAHPTLPKAGFHSSGAETILVPLSVTKFLTRPFWATISFVKNEKDKVTQLNYGYNARDYIPVRDRWAWPMESIGATVRPRVH